MTLSTWPKTSVTLSQSTVIFRREKSSVWANFDPGILPPFTVFARRRMNGLKVPYFLGELNPNCFRCIRDCRPFASCNSDLRIKRLFRKYLSCFQQKLRRKRTCNYRILYSVINCHPVENTSFDGKSTMTSRLLWSSNGFNNSLFFRFVSRGTGTVFGQSSTASPAITQVIIPYLHPNRRTLQPQCEEPVVMETRRPIRHALSLTGSRRTRGVWRTSWQPDEGRPFFGDFPRERK